MGGVISTIQDSAAAIGQGIKILISLNSRYQEVLKRIDTVPSLPVPNATQPYWMDDAPFPELNDIKETLPQEVDVIVIGSGITSVSATKAILELLNPAPKVLVLEARDICSGATGRNGGHIKATPYRDFVDHARTLGSHEKARDITRFEMRHLEMLKEFADIFPVAEIREVETIDVFFETKDFEQAKEHVAITKKWLPEIEINILGPQEAKEKYQVNELIIGGITYQAGALWPFRFVTSLWKDLTAKYSNLTLVSNTPVTSVKPTIDSYYTVETPRGNIRARHVLHATNGYAGHLLSQLRGSLTGVRGHMSAQQAGSAFPAFNGDKSWSVIYEPGFDYVTQRPNGPDGSPGDVMIGGGFSRSGQEGLDSVAVWDDSVKDGLSLIHVLGVMPTIYEPKWGIGGGVKKSWTGIMGFTGDMLPFVGQIPEARKSSTAAQWIAAGFNGHGMVWSWLSGTAVGIMIAGRDQDHLDKAVGRPDGKLDDWFPQKMLALSEKRLKRADLKNLADQVM